MAISINWATRVISVPKADLTVVSAPTLYELNINTFRLWLKDEEDSEAGMPYPRTHNHNTEATLAGATFARLVEMINGYTVTFEDGQYAVRFTGANTNVHEVTNVNQVSVRSNNSAGLVTVASAVSLTSNIKQNQALASFSFLMTDSTNHAPAAGLTVTVTRSIDGGAFAAGTLSAVTEVSDGLYKVSFAAADLNGKVVVLKAVATGADMTVERLVTQP